MQTPELKHENYNFLSCEQFISEHLIDLKFKTLIYEAWQLRLFVPVFPRSRSLCIYARQPRLKSQQFYLIPVYNYGHEILKITPILKNSFFHSQRYSGGWARGDRWICFFKNSRFEHEFGKRFRKLHFDLLRRKRRRRKHSAFKNFGHFWDFQNNFWP